MVTIGLSGVHYHFDSTITNYSAIHFVLFAQLFIYLFIYVKSPSLHRTTV